MEQVRICEVRTTAVISVKAIPATRIRTMFLLQAFFYCEKLPSTFSFEVKYGPIGGWAKCCVNETHFINPALCYTAAVGCMPVDTRHHT